jgi:hypothetical protein
MTNHHSGPSAADEIRPIFPVGLPIDEVALEQDHPTVAGKKADTGELVVASIMPRTEESAGQKIFLPWQPNEPRFAPQQYYYAASKSGVCRAA